MVTQQSASFLSAITTANTLVQEEYPTAILNSVTCSPAIISQPATSPYQLTNLTCTFAGGSSHPNATIIIKNKAGNWSSWWSPVLENQPIAVGTNNLGWPLPNEHGKSQPLGLETAFMTAITQDPNQNPGFASVVLSAPQNPKKSAPAGQAYYVFTLVQENSATQVVGVQDGKLYE